MSKSEKLIRHSLKEYGRGITGGLLFSVPMLYTMELWWAGFTVDPLPLLMYFIVGIFLLLIYNHYVGLREDASFMEGLLESFEEMGVGLLLTVFILWITNRIAPDMSFMEISGKIIVEAVTVAIGISVGKSQLSGGEDRDKEEKSNFESTQKQEKDRSLSQENHIFRSINMALCGAILIASNVAPTEEVVVIALESPPYKIFGIALISIGIGGAVLYNINFKGSKEWIIKPNSRWDALAGSAVMYSVALLASAFMLWFFGRFENVSLYAMVAQTVVLGFPAALGASAGRLLIQS
jgi:putative integral membrane protein (TIGR02587 family)